jgi:hypothetical protein
MDKMDTLIGTIACHRFGVCTAGEERRAAKRWRAAWTEA